MKDIDSILLEAAYLEVIEEGVIDFIKDCIGKVLDKVLSYSPENVAIAVIASLVMGLLSAVFIPATMQSEKIRIAFAQHKPVYVNIGKPETFSNDPKMIKAIMGSWELKLNEKQTKSFEVDQNNKIIYTKSLDNLSPSKMVVTAKELLRLNPKIKDFHPVDQRGHQMTQTYKARSDFNSATISVGNRDPELKNTYETELNPTFDKRADYKTGKID
jgi:hypothetical protein